MNNSRNEDERIERVIAQYLDKYLYPKLGPSERVEDERQYRGVDVVLSSTAGVYNLDEKAKYNGLINQDVQYIGLELSRLIRNGERCDGWFLDSDSATDLYAITSIHLREGDTPEQIRTDNIKELHVLLVSPRRIWSWLRKHDLDRNLLRKTVHEMSSGGKEWARWPNSSDWVAKIKRSDHLDEQPINLVLRRETLIQEMGAGEVIVTEAGAKRVNHK